MAEITTIVESLKALNTKLGGSSSASTKADALKDIYVTLGGNASDVEEVSTVTEMIQKVTEVASGGGGGGDFSTATVTVIANSNTPLTVPVAVDDPLADAARGFYPVWSGSTNLTVILYKGAAFLTIDPNDDTHEITNVSGNASIVDDGIVIITGDCTVTAALIE